MRNFYIDFVIPFAGRFESLEGGFHLKSFMLRVSATALFFLTKEKPLLGAKDSHYIVW